ncbi:MAG: ferritin [Elusimicrobia bacterium RIFOXYB2_FULL_49_7]|nr:MAG: ferritin [Elusimicrobia bacterium RIFOXYB2_FULL_49_7]
MISEKLQEALNEQINKELFSEYLYLQMQSWFASENLDGFVNFFTVQTQEERFHGMKFYQYLIERGGKVLLKPLEGPTNDFKNAEEIFSYSLNHEKFVTQRIHHLMDLAITEKDHSLVSFLKWFIDEQVEEESTFEKALAKIKLVGNNGMGLLMLDQEMAKRVFSAPAANRADATAA